MTKGESIIYHQIEDLPNCHVAVIHHRQNILLYVGGQTTLFVVVRIILCDFRAYFPYTVYPTANCAFVEGFFYVDLVGCEGVKQRIHQIGLIAALALADMIADDRNHRTKIASLHVFHSKTVNFQSISAQCVFAPRDVE